MPFPPPDRPMMTNPHRIAGALAAPALRNAALSHAGGFLSDDDYRTRCNASLDDALDRAELELARRTTPDELTAELLELEEVA